MSGATPNLVYACEPWEIDVGRRELRSGGTPIVLGSRAFEIVEALAQARGELVTKDDLMARIWPGAVVGENTLHVHISALRKALGPDRGMLKTTPGRGYRLIGRWTILPGVAVAPAGRQPRPPPAERPPGNFPVIVTQLVGRSAAVQHARDLISAYRVVTLTGAGGIGKTSLAMKAVRGLLAEFPQGAWLVELAALSDPALAPSTVAAVLGLTLGSERITPEALARAIGERHLMLVLDNCEHLIDAVAALVETVTRLCPRVSVLATSREVMRIEGEAVYRVPALEVPAADQETPERILAAAAVALFVNRAKALDSSFAPRPEDLVAIAGICRQLDGIPLAIEFAAARAAFVGIAQVAAGLRDRFAILTSGRRTAIAQHRTLRAVLDWSYQLLSPREQRLLRHLAVFAGGFSLDAAEAVGGMEAADASIVDDLSSLVSKSLCERVNETSVTRWRLLETIRAYGLEKLTEAGERSQAARRHAGYFCDLIAPLTAGSTFWLSQEAMEPGIRELDNVRAALDWAFSPEGDPEIGARLTAAFAPVWQTLSLMGECRTRVERMLALRPAGMTLGRATELCMWLAYAEALAMTFAPVARTRGASTTAIDLAATFDDLDLQAGLLYMQWSVEFISGNQGAALIAARQLAAAALRGGDTIKLVSDRILGASLLSAGRLADAQDCLQRVVDGHIVRPDGHHPLLFRRDPRVLARVRLAMVLALQGQLDRATAAARESVEAAQASGAGITVCWAVHDAVCPIALMTGDLAAADAAIAAMDDWAARLDAALWKMMATGWKGRLLIERGAFAPGVELITQTLDACAQSGWQMSYVQFLGYLAQGLAGLGRLDDARAAMDRAIAWADDKGETWYRPELLRRRGELLLLPSGIAGVAEAETCFAAAQELGREQGGLFWELRIALSLARLRLAQGRSDAVAPLLAPVYERFTEGFETAPLRAAKALLDAS